MKKLFYQESSALLKLALPMVAGGAAFTIVPFVNTAYAGRLGEDQLAAGALVNSAFIFFMVLFWGVFSTVSALIARYEGEENGHLSGQVFRSGMVLAMALSIPVMIFFYFAGDLFRMLGQGKEIVELAQTYCRALSFAIMPDFLLNVLCDLCLGVSRPKYVMVSTLILIPLNLILNHCFAFGAWGFPQLGLAGLGVGTAVAYWILLLGFALTLFYSARFKIYFKSSCWFVKKQALELLKQGIPVGVQWIFEVGFFASVALLMGYIGPLALAAHQIAFQTYSLFFAVYYSLNQAVMVRMAEGVGAEKLHQVRYTYICNYLFIVLLAVVLLVACLIFQKQLLHFYLGEDYAREGALIQLAHSLLYLVPLYFIADCLGFAHFTALRAFKDTRFTMCVALTAYWLFAVPLMWIGIHFWHWHNPANLWFVMIAAGLLSFSGQSLRYHYQYANFRHKLAQNAS